MSATELPVENRQLDQCRLRRIAQRAPVLDLAVVERLVVLGHRLLQQRVLRLEGLDHHAPGPLAAPGATRDLRQQLERPLGRAEVGQPQRLVRRQHADERDPREVVPLGDHLRADEHVDLSTIELAQQLLVGRLPTQRVPIHPGNPGVGHGTSDQRLDLLRALARQLELVPVTFGAAVRIGDLERAVVTAQSSCRAMPGQAHAAVGARHPFAATRTEQGDGPAAPVSQDQRLLPARDRIAQQRQQHLRHGPDDAVALVLLAHVDQHHVR